MEYKDLKKIPFKTLSESKNIAEEFDQNSLDFIGRRIGEWYRLDKESRSGWEKKYDKALELALQIKEEKTYPWPKASNIKFPLLTIASLQFSARVYPTLIKPPDVVRVRKMGADVGGNKASRAYRVGKYMSYQLLEEDEDWEEEQDKLFIILPIIGCAFKKTYYDEVEDRVDSKLILPEDLVIHYFAKGIDTAERITERFKLFERAIEERVREGIYLKVDFTSPPQPDKGDHSQVADKRQGITPPSQAVGDDDKPREILECHCYWDFDQDGYKEPYIITIDKDTNKVLRIVARFQEVISEQSKEIEKIKAQTIILASTMPQQMPQNMPAEQRAQMMEQAHNIERQVQMNQQKMDALSKEDPDIIKIIPLNYFTKYSFLPSPDGGIYDVGFGQLLSPLNESVNSIINQLVDAGTLQNGNSGFIGRGARIEGGRLRFEPFEWKHVNVPGGDLKSAIVPLPVNAPSAVLFQLLQLIISYAERVSSVTEVMQGNDVGQNTPAYNMNAMLEQGLQVFNGVFKRVYRSFREEIRKIYRLNGMHMDIAKYVETMDGPVQILKSDFQLDDKDIVPAADPNAFSSMENLLKAQFLAQRSMQAPGYNPVAVELRLMDAMDITDTNEIYPLDDKGNWLMPPPPNPEIELKKAEEQRRTLEAHSRMATDAALAHSKMGVDQAQMGLLQSQAEATDDKQIIERAKLLAGRQEQVHEAYMKKMDLILKQHDLIGKQADIASKQLDLQSKAADTKAKLIGNTIDLSTKAHEAANKKEISDDKVAISKKRVREASKPKSTK